MIKMYLFAAMKKQTAVVTSHHGKYLWGGWGFTVSLKVICYKNIIISQWDKSVQEEPEQR